MISEKRRYPGDHSIDDSQSDNLCMVWKRSDHFLLRLRLRFGWWQLYSDILEASREECQQNIIIPYACCHRVADAIIPVSHFKAPIIKSPSDGCMRIEES